MVERKYGKQDGGNFVIPSMTYLLAAINREKKEKNVADVELAKKYFSTEDFKHKFTYLRRGTPMVKTEQIAYHWRNSVGPLEGEYAATSAWWDKIESYTKEVYEED